MKKNIIISILATIIIVFTILSIIGMSINEEKPVTQTNLYRDAFMEGCTSDGVKFAYCSCVYDNGSEEYGEIEFKKLLSKSTDANNLPNEVMKLVIKCSPLNK